MRALLFRRIVIDGVNYYQLFKDDSNFNNESMYADYNNRNNSEFFYIDKDSNIIVPDESLLNIYCDDNNSLKTIDDFTLFDQVSRAFNEKYHYFKNEKKSVDDVVNNIKRIVLFQDNCIRNLVEQIYLNQDIVNSNLPKDIKLMQKNNILFHGKVGSGKKTIIDALEKELDIPYADIVIGPDIKDTLEKVIKELLSKAKSPEEASRGIVFVRDNYDDLSEIIGQNVTNYIDFLTSQGAVNYNGTPIDFRTITFVILFDEHLSTSLEEIRNIQDMANCTCCIGTRDLSIMDKYLILFSPNGRLNYYEKFLNENGKKLIIDDKSLLRIITKCSSLDPNMNVLNSIIDGIIKIGICNGINDISIDEKVVRKILPLFDIQRNDNNKVNNKSFEVYWFEKQVDEIVAKTKEYVIGQDKAVKMLVRQLVNNIRWANKEGIEKPKNYIKNILIRGNSGTGKTFIAETVLKYLGVPYYIANATEYTEAGYVGRDVEDMLVDLYHAAGDDLEKAERGVLVIDEIDKRATKSTGGSRDVSGSGVQEALYKFAEGTIIKINVGNRMNEIPVYFDTSRLTIIGEGAFEGIEEIRDERIGKRKTGFGDHNANGKDPSIIDEDYISYGMKTQFMRRVKEVIELNDVTKEQFIDIMKKSKSSALEIERISLADQGIEIEYTESFYEALADKALSMKQGVTGIEKSLVKVLQSINIEDIRASKIKKIILDGDVVNNPEKVILVEREKQKVKRIK